MTLFDLSTVFLVLDQLVLKRNSPQMRALNAKISIFDLISLVCSFGTKYRIGYAKKMIKMQHYTGYAICVSKMCHQTLYNDAQGVIRLYLLVAMQPALLLWRARCLFLNLS